MGKKIEPQSATKGALSRNKSESVVDLDLLSFAQEKPSITFPETEGGPPRVLKPGLQLLLRIIFTFLAAGYFFFNTKDPLFLGRIAIVGLAGLLLGIFLLFHLLMKRGEFFFRGIPAAALLDVAASSAAWICDPWEPAPMMLLS